MDPRDPPKSPPRGALKPPPPRVPPKLPPEGALNPPPRLPPKSPPRGALNPPDPPLRGVHDGPSLRGSLREVPPVDQLPPGIGDGASDRPVDQERPAAPLPKSPLREGLPASMRPVDQDLAASPEPKLPAPRPSASPPPVDHRSDRDIGAPMKELSLPRPPVPRVAGSPPRSRGESVLCSPPDGFTLRTGPLPLMICGI